MIVILKGATSKFLLDHCIYLTFPNFLSCTYRFFSISDTRIHEYSLPEALFFIDLNLTHTRQLRLLANNVDISRRRGSREIWAPASVPPSFRPKIIHSPTDRLSLEAKKLPEVDHKFREFIAVFTLAIPQNRLILDG